MKPFARISLSSAPLRLCARIILLCKRRNRNEYSDDVYAGAELCNLCMDNQ